MEENAALSAKSLIEQENRQYNETNALYHAARCSSACRDYSILDSVCAVQQCRPAYTGADVRRMVPAQADPQLAVRSMVEQGLLVLTPAPGGKRAKNLNLTESGRALAEKTIARVVRAERQPYAAWGWSAWKQTLPSGRDTCRNCGKNLHS